MLILVSVSLLELVTAVFFYFVNFQTFLKKLEVRSGIRPYQDAQRDSQQRADTDYEFSKESATYMKGNLLFPKRNFIPDLLAVKCSNERVLR
jgi:hypothetical protein